jgi:hypothetical protein
VGGEFPAGVQMVDGDREEAVHLRRVQGHGEDPVHSGRRHEVGDQPSAEGDAGLVLLVGAGVGVVRHDDGDPARRRPAGRVAHQQQLHEMLLHGLDQGLHEKDIAFPAVRLQLDLQAVVGEPAEPGRAEGHAEVGAHLGGEVGVGAAAEHGDVSH